MPNMIDVTVDYEYEIVAANWTCPVCGTHNNMTTECDICSFYLCDNHMQVIGDTMNFEFYEDEIKEAKNEYLGITNEDE